MRLIAGRHGSASRSPWIHLFRPIIWESGLYIESSSRSSISCFLQNPDGICKINSNRVYPQPESHQHDTSRYSTEPTISIDGPQISEICFRKMSGSGFSTTAITCLQHQSDLKEYRMRNSSHPAKPAQNQATPGVQETYGHFHQGKAAQNLPWHASPPRTRSPLRCKALSEEKTAQAGKLQRPD